MSAFDQGDFGFAGDFKLAKGDATVWGISLAPTYWLLPGTLQLVGRYQYAGTDEAGSLVSSLDTGLIRRPETPTPTAAPAEGTAVAAPARRVNATDEMITELFVRFDTEMKKFTEAKGNVRSDLFSRMSGNNVKSADLSAGLRHNINLMLQHVK